MSIPFIRSISNNFNCSYCDCTEYSAISIQPLVVICDECGEIQDNIDFIVEETEE